MNKIKGFIDPVSLTAILILGIGVTGVMTGKNTVDEEQMAQSNQTEIITPAKEDPKT